MLRTAVAPSNASWISVSRVPYSLTLGWLKVTWTENGSGKFCFRDISGIPIFARIMFREMLKINSSIFCTLIANFSQWPPPPKSINHARIALNIFIIMFKTKLYLSTMFGLQLWPATVTDNCGRHLWPATVAGNCDRQLWPIILASNCGQLLWLKTVAGNCSGQL